MKASRVRGITSIRRGPFVRLPERRLRFSRRAVALSLALIVGGAALMFVPWRRGPVVGACGVGAGFVVLFTAGYYWACGNESCS